MPKVVIICTSATKLGDKSTGVWIEELAAPYYEFKDRGFEVVLGSMAGGPVPIDAGSMGEGFFTDAAKKFMHDGDAVGALCHTPALADIDFASADGVFVPGGHGCCTDMADSPALKGAIETVFAAGKAVAAVCHGPMALPQCNKPDGTPLVAGHAVAGFSNTEESAVGLTDAVPFLLEDKLKEKGGLYERGEDWNSKVCVANGGLLVTGQNPQSSEATAKAFADAVAAL